MSNPLDKRPNIHFDPNAFYNSQKLHHFSKKSISLIKYPQVEYMPTNERLKTNNVNRIRNSFDTMISDLIVILFIIVIALTFSACNKNFNQNSSQILNSTDNELNATSNPQPKEQIYYINESDNRRLYKISTDGISKHKITNDSIGNLSFSGDWIYYSNESDNAKIYKIKVDGSQRTEIADVSGVSGIPGILDIIATDDWIYYTMATESGALYRIKTDGSEKMLLSGDGCLFPKVINDWIYYSDPQGRGIYKMNINGTNKTRITNDRDYILDISNNYIIYETWISKENHTVLLPLKLSKIKIDGSDNTDIYNYQNKHIYSFNIYNDWILYKDVSNRIHKMKLNGTEDTALTNDISPYNVTIDEGFIYYSNESDGNNLYKVNINSGENLKLSEDACSLIFINNKVKSTNYTEDDTNQDSQNLINTSTSSAHQSLDTSNDYESAVCRIIVNGTQKIALTGKTNTIMYAKENYTGHIVIQAKDGTVLADFDNSPPPAAPTTQQGQSNNVVVDSGNIVVIDRLYVTGRSRLNFEGTLTFRLKDASGNIILDSYTQSGGGDNFEPFTIDILMDRSKVKSTTGFLEFYSEPMIEGETEKTLLAAPVSFQ